MVLKQNGTERQILNLNEDLISQISVTAFGQKATVSNKEQVQQLGFNLFAKFEHLFLNDLRKVIIRKSWKGKLRKTVFITEKLNKLFTFVSKQKLRKILWRKILLARKLMENCILWWKKRKLKLLQSLSKKRENES